MPTTNNIDQDGGGSARPGERRWKTALSHNGVTFQLPYVRHDVPVLIRGSAASKTLSDDAEEFATLFVRLTMRMTNMPAGIRDNFWKDWSRMLPRGTVAAATMSHKGDPLASFDFSRIEKHLTSKRTKDSAKSVATKRTAAVDTSIAVVDGVHVPVIGHVVEGPGIFIGRGGGTHPLAGRIKRRIKPADVTINIGKGQHVPKPPSSSWAAVIHDPFVDWVASWRDPLTGLVKYARLALHAHVDRLKFENARAVAGKLEGIVQKVSKGIASADPQERQLATCAWLLLNTAARVGGSTSRSRTFGLTTLLKKHVTVSRDAVTLDFVGKDHVRYNRRLRSVPRRIIANISALMAADADSPVFALIPAPERFNEYLGTSLHEGLTGKVIRTCLASTMFERTLFRMGLFYRGDDDDDDDDDKEWAKVALLVAGAKVAVLCNHRVATTITSGVRNDAIDDALDALIARIKRRGRDKITHREATSLVKAIISDNGLSLSTSRINYVDPRIPAAFASRHGLPMTTTFPGAALKTRFAWAIDEADNRNQKTSMFYMYTSVKYEIERL